MSNVHYMISEAAKQVGAEPHALRYWEDELALTIGRTEMGHRYYTKEDIQLFRCIKELKEQGMLLKDLKELIPDMLDAREQLRIKRTVTTPEPETCSEDVSALSMDTSTPSDLEGLLRSLLAENNLILSERLLKGIDALLQLQEQQEEERYRKLDFAIRQQQLVRKNTALAPLGRLRKLVQV